jgi:Na+/H+ antiporter NhaD/arsenite permease-like protein
VNPRPNGAEEAEVTLRWIVLIVSGLVYLFLCLSARHRPKALWIGIGLMMLCARLFPADDVSNALSFRSVFLAAINWNVLGVLAGAMLIADLFLDSGVPVLLADKIASRFRTAHGALVAVCLFAGGISALVDNVTTVLLVAPVALAIAKRTQMNPIPVMVGIAICANLEGAATLIGDPPSMLLAGEYKLGFNDFFVYQGRPSVFFAIQAGAVAGAAVLYLIFRRHQRPMDPVPVERPNTWVPVLFIALMIAFLASSSHFDPGFTWLAGTGNLILAAAALAWTASRHPRNVKRIISKYNWQTILFLAGIFVFAYALDEFGWVQRIADMITSLAGDNRFATYTIIVWLSVAVSAFIDNIAYVAVMLPVTSALGGDPRSSFLYAAGLLIGACLGGNITPIGASCNVVACGILQREGRPVSFRQFTSIGLPFTLAATGAGYLFIWVFWH